MVEIGIVNIKLFHRKAIEKGSCGEDVATRFPEAATNP